jgi:hypothetical protein
MRTVVVTDGRDPLTAPIVDYLERRYGPGITADIVGLVLNSHVSEVQTLTVTLRVRVEDEDEERDRP